jgi:hypothetical protein
MEARFVDVQRCRRKRRKWRKPKRCEGQQRKQERTSKEEGFDAMRCRRPVPPTHHLKSAIRKIDKIVWKLHDEQLAAYIAYVLAVSKGEKREIRKLFEQNLQRSETSRLHWNANSRRRKDAAPFGLQPTKARWRPCTTQHNGSEHVWKPPICSNEDSRTALWMNAKRGIQRPLMLANVRRLADQEQALSADA